mmetsp:Transcript_65220/g.115855  ORF Transcript_65220/g.115855 Transcript_65220/m.115855 type:complete len:96 (+) Transcript_65220:96-383(+)|eukprot:CAMPEP_0197656322 /NCGR_PEP_ID=MMETSP1338-20131121/41313_1 /TAXON_ID=43686 ORGANISM="Pelagodinium beii, Strain RCC1491" /NCGR_SAMPLE_ID=MMETSP1338 /ASSEMBLY_ACC=CAM_ASM_000754 /LENGTH=95 /DNA_ID=CAMNT_0043232269 /DNA_START=74 /DNA_END=361 /DNA_ORIENTATION=-
MARGNAREKDRAANLKKQAEAVSAHSTIKAADSTAEIMRQKQAAAEAKKAAEAAEGIVSEKKGPSKADKRAEAAKEMAMTGRQATAAQVAAKRPK